MCTSHFSSKVLGKLQLFVENFFFLNCWNPFDNHKELKKLFKPAVERFYILKRSTCKIASNYNSLNIIIRILRGFWFIQGFSVHAFLLHNFNITTRAPNKQKRRNFYDFIPFTRDENTEWKILSILWILQKRRIIVSRENSMFYFISHENISIIRAFLSLQTSVLDKFSGKVLLNSFVATFF